MDDAFIQFERITKTFAGVTALDAVSLSIARGECHGLMGENGAGKSTLGKILAGIYRSDSGQILLRGSPCVFHSPGEAMKFGVGMVHQELAFCPDLSVAENLSTLEGANLHMINLVVHHAMKRAESISMQKLQEIAAQTAAVGAMAAKMAGSAAAA